MPFDSLDDDAMLVCAECGSEFTFTAKEKRMFGAKGWTPPKRCLACRSEKRERQKRWDDAREKSE
jgi:hypothetical protein